MNAIVEAMALLTPSDINIPKIRVGPREDGGYVLAENIRSCQPVISYGIGTEYRFDAELAARGHRVYMFDHTIDKITCADAEMLWFKEGIAAVSDDSKGLYTIEDHLRRHGIEGNNLILKMDVDGVEIDVLGTTPPEALCRFEQIVVEVHELERLTETDYRERVVRMLTNLNCHFTLFHAHDNNYAGGSAPYIVDGLPWISVIELSYVRLDLAQASPSQTLYPTIFDHPNAPFPEKKLWFFPFLPARVSVSCFAESAALLDKRWLETAAAVQCDEAFDTSGLVDIAVGKHASQSSTSVFSTLGEAGRAVSGRISEAFSFHTNIEMHPWWEVDLGAEFPIQAIVLYNRGDGYAYRAYSFSLHLACGEGGFTRVYERRGRPFGNRESPACIVLRGRSARFVRVQLDARDYLHLDAVMVLVSEMAAKELQRPHTNHDG